MLLSDAVPAIGTPGGAWKKVSMIHIDKLCTLLLMEADFNFGNKILFGHQMMLQAQDS